MLASTMISPAYCGWCGSLVFRVPRAHTDNLECFLIEAAGFLTLEMMRELNLHFGREFNFFYKPLAKLPHARNHAGVLVNTTIAKGGWYLTIVELPASKVNHGQPATMREKVKELKQFQESGRMGPYSFRFVFKTYSLAEAEAALDALHAKPGDNRAMPQPRGDPATFLPLGHLS